VKLFLQNSNLHDHDTSTLRTDGRTDGELAYSCLGNTALRYVSRGNKRTVGLWIVLYCGIARFALLLRATCSI